MLLSIGMIVKNEEKHLERCLKALQQFNGKLDYEIVIVDTGSTDRTVEIAKKYTDKVYFFEWINDFAAARNYGLEKCVGKWFMFLDADEEIVSCDSIVDFLLNPESSKCSAAAIKMKSFSGSTKNKYGMATLARIFKNEDIKFNGKIHETISVDEKVKVLDCLVLHYGYVGDMTIKYQRNDSIIDEMIEEDPINLKWLCYKMDSLYYQKKYKKIMKLFEEKIKSRNNIDNNQISYFYRIMNTIIKMYLDLEKIDIAKEYFRLASDSFKDYEIVLLDFYFSFIDKWNKKNIDDIRDDVNVETYIVDYLRLYNKYINNEFDDYSIAFFTIDVNVNKYSIAKYLLAKYYLSNTQYSKMEQCLNSLYFKDCQLMPFDLELELMSEVNNYERIIKVYTLMEGIDKEKEFIELVQSTRDDKIVYKKIMNALNNSIDVIASPLKEYISIVNANKINSELIIKLSSFEKLPEALSDALYYLMKNNVCIDGFKWLHCTNLQDKYALSMMTYHYDICEVVLNSINGIDKPINRNVLGFYTSLLYYTLISDQLSDDEYLYIEDKYIEWQMARARGLYKEELFNDTDINLLPNEVEFCYYLDNAIENINNNKYNDAINYIKKAMKMDDKLVRCCKLLLAVIEENQKEFQSQNEFEQYAIKVKTAIVGLIQSNRVDEAITLYDQYKAINPKDNDLDDCFKRSSNV
ncbi:MAG: glycosyltransferase family 2 protein [Erysipelotrichales bacterium]|nr:glycosyltransferase family 2 protein [Erysipelotrichales bacterium]